MSLLAVRLRNPRIFQSIFDGLDSSFCFDDSKKCQSPVLRFYLTFHCNGNLASNGSPSKFHFWHVAQGISLLDIECVSDLDHSRGPAELRLSTRGLNASKIFASLRGISVKAFYYYPKIIL